MSVEKVTVAVVQMTCDLCGEKAEELRAWRGPDQAKQMFLPQGWRARDRNGVLKHVCNACLEGLER